MNKHLTEIAFILDRSGSMHAMQNEAIGGFNAFIGAQQKEAGQAQLSLILFDHEYSPLTASIPIEEMPELSERDYQPRGTTALLDAIGRTIDELGERLAKLPEDKRPGHVIVVTLTDGLENASQDYTDEAVGKRIQHQQDKYNWEFIFLAGDLKTIRQAGQLNISNASRVHYRKNPEGMADGMRSASKMVSESRQRQRRRNPE